MDIVINSAVKYLEGNLWLSKFKMSAHTHTYICYILYVMYYIYVIYVCYMLYIYNLFCYMSQHLWVLVFSMIMLTQVFKHTCAKMHCL